MQNIKILISIVLVATTITMMNMAQAEVTIPAGWYIEGNLGAAKASETNPESGKDSGSGYSINLGYKIIPFFGAEIGYSQYIDIKARLWDIAAKAIVPLQETGMDIFAKLGAARVTEQGSSSGSGTNSLFYGLGADYAYTPHLNIVLQWTQANNDGLSGNLNLFSIGLNYIMG